MSNILSGRRVDIMIDAIRSHEATFLEFSARDGEPCVIVMEDDGRIKDYWLRSVKVTDPEHALLCAIASQQIHQ